MAGKRCGPQFAQQAFEPARLARDKPLRTRFTAQDQGAFSRALHMLEQGSHRAGIQVLPSHAPGLQVAAQGTVSQFHGHAGGNAVCGGPIFKTAGAMQPESIYRGLPLVFTGLIDRVVIEQHLYLALQSGQCACARPLRQPVLDIVSAHPLEAGAGQTIQQIALEQPVVAVMPVQLQAILVQQG